MQNVQLFSLNPIKCVNVYSDFNKNLNQILMKNAEKSLKYT